MTIIAPVTRVTRSGMHLLLRSADACDAAPLLGIVRDVVAEQNVTISTLAEFNVDQRQEVEWIHHRRVRTDQVAIVAVHQAATAASGARSCQVSEKVAGLVFAEGGDWQRTAHTAELHLVVAEKFRSQGVGRALMEAQISWAKQHKSITQLYLNVFASNQRAIQLYRSLGFQEDGRRPNAIRIEAKDQPPQELDDVLMSLYTG